jgi:hypothetical protein
MPALAADVPAPMPSPLGVADKWRCVGHPDPSPTATVTPDPVVLDDGADPPVPTATVTPPPYPDPSPTATDSVCHVTSWATPAPETPAAEVTVTADPTDPQTVTLAPDQFDRVNALGATSLWLLGVVAMVVIAFLIWTTSTPPRFGLRR